MPTLCEISLCTPTFYPEGSLLVPWQGIGRKLLSYWSVVSEDRVQGRQSDWKMRKEIPERRKLERKEPL